MICPACTTNLRFMMMIQTTARPRIYKGFAVRSRVSSTLRRPGGSKKQGIISWVACSKPQPTLRLKQRAGGPLYTQLAQYMWY